ncbi:MAG TPA: ACP phosphodiesterase [Parafilimonas sp.]|nr:ACP phosphodiesterase [Parafilimonas sp.]
MNYLAHAWLSFNQPGILVGNMISDFVKGKKRFSFSESIQQGIILHRSIDEFTDAHHATKKAKQFLKPVVGLYAGAFIDIAYDHFLANDASEFNNDKSLLNFSLLVYKTLKQYKASLPERFAHILPYMESDNWLFNYKTLYGTEQSFKGLLRRAKYLENNSDVFEAFQKNYESLQACYEVFFPDVKNFAFRKFSGLLI